MSQDNFASAIMQMLTDSKDGQTYEENIAQLRNAVDFYRGQVKNSIAAGHTPMEIMAGYGDAMDDVTAKKNALMSQEGMAPSCGKGCSNCCHYYVSITEIEAKAIVEYCDKASIPIDTEYLKSQASHNMESFKYQAHRR